MADKELLNPEESHVIDLITQAFNAYNALPRLHPMDLGEFVRATHVLQNIVMSRPVMREWGIDYWARFKE